jgi:hypothetical protein
MHSRLATLIMSAACLVGTIEEADRLLATANRYWLRTDAPDRDEVLDCAMLIREAIALRLAGSVQLAMRREREAERILFRYDV